MPKKGRLLPTGECWDGCGAQVALGSFFAAGHDRRAEGMLIAMEYGSVAEFLAAKGFAPHEKNLLKTFEDWKRRGEQR